MATGRELVRMMSCGIWDKYIKSRKDFRSAQIFDSIGKPISLSKAETETFCFARVLFKDCPKDSLKLIEALLCMVASTSSEHMGSKISEVYGFDEIIIS